MNELKIVATIVAKAEFKEDILNTLRTVTDGTRKEAGNVSYTLHENTQNPLQFTILEVWKSQDAIDFHNQTPHFQAFKEAIDGKIDSLSIDVMREIY